MPLEHISSQSSLSNFVKASDLWKQIIAFEQFAGFISEIDRIKMLPENRSEWLITLDSAPFTWVETDSPDKNSYTLMFNCISGDFENFSGSWKIIKDSSHCNQLKLEIDYYLGIPVLEDLINNVLKEKVQKFADSMTKAHSDRISVISSDARVSNRFSIGKNIGLTINNRTQDVYVVNLSEGGLMFELHKGLLQVPELADIKITTDSFVTNGKLTYEPFAQCYRIVFSEKLSNETLRSTLKSWNDQSGKDLIKVFEVLTSETYCTTGKIPAK